MFLSNFLKFLVPPFQNPAYATISIIGDHCEAIAPQIFACPPKNSVLAACLGDEAVHSNVANVKVNGIRVENHSDRIQ